MVGFRFDFVPYPLWRRTLPAAVKTIAHPLYRRWLAADADLQPPTSADAMARYLARWGLLDNAQQALEQSSTRIETVRADVAPPPYTGGPIRLPAQWEPMESIMLTWPSLYPPLWAAHAEMVEAISAVCGVMINVTSPLWGQAAALFLQRRGKANLDRVRFLYLPTNDIWVRDYGPFVGLDSDGNQVAVDAIFDPLEHYPQEQDDQMPQRWAAHDEIPLRALDLHIEGGNVWSDGAGTLLMSDDLLLRHADLGREEITRRLHETFAFDKLIITPHLALEETSHVDLLVKLADARTALVAAPTTGLNDRRLEQAAELLRHETNAQGERYRVVMLPMPPLVLNWGIFPVWRSYTNALTVNGRVLVPVFGVPQDARALDIYRRYMPDHDVIAIDCSGTANGGGAVHCLTKEVPRAQKR